MFKKFLYATAALAMAASAANASIVSYDFATVKVIAQPATVNQLSPADNKFILAFNEKQRFTLTSALTTDQGVIAAGTKVDSHIMLYNKEMRSSVTFNQQGNVAFSGNILGVISLRGILLASDYLGAPTNYADFQNRGLDEGKLDSYTITGNNLFAQFFVNNPGDWIRVISVAEVPVPAAAALLPMGFAALVGLRRRRKTA